MKLNHEQTIRHLISLEVELSIWEDNTRQHKVA